MTSLSMFIRSRVLETVLLNERNVCPAALWGMDTQLNTSNRIIRLAALLAVVVALFGLTPPASAAAPSSPYTADHTATINPAEHCLSTDTHFAVVEGNTPGFGGFGPATFAPDPGGVNIVDSASVPDVTRSFAFRPVSSIAEIVVPFGTFTAPGVAGGSAYPGADAVNGRAAEFTVLCAREEGTINVFGAPIPFAPDGTQETVETLDNPGPAPFEASIEVDESTDPIVVDVCLAIGRSASPSTDHPDQEWLPIGGDYSFAPSVLASHYGSAVAEPTIIGDCSIEIPAMATGDIYRVCVDMTSMVPGEGKTLEVAPACIDVLATAIQVTMTTTTVPTPTTTVPTPTTVPVEPTPTTVVEPTPTTVADPTSSTTVVAPSNPQPTSPTPTAVTSQSEELAETGASPTLFVLVGLGMVLAGAGALTASRRRSQI